MQSDTVRLLRYALPFKGTLGAALVVALVGAAFEVARPWPTKVIVDYALSGRPFPPWLAELTGSTPSLATRPGLIVAAVLASVFLVICSAAASLATQVIVFGVAQKMVVSLSGQVFSKLQRLSLSFHQRHAVGDLTQRLGGDVFVVQAAICAVGIPAIASLLSLFGMVFLMLRLDAVLALVTLSMVPLLLLALLVFKKPMHKANEQQWRRQGEMMAFINQSLSGVRLIQGYAREAYFERLMAGHALGLGDAYVKSMRIGAGYMQVTTIITALVGATLLGVGSMRVLDGALTLGDLLVFLGYLAMIATPITGIATAIGTATALNSRGRRVLEILDSSEEVSQRKNSVTLQSVRGDVEFAGVSFGYPGNSPDASAGPEPLVFSDISFRARAGQVTAIIGVTGAGKSSMVSLLSRFYDPTSGVIRLDGHDLRDLALKPLRESVAVVSQDPVLFPMTVQENIAFGRPGATRNEIIAAAKTACAHEFIEALPNGYDTKIAERGASLSGGERQR
ncbi:MAG: ABC transporter ATP-binding protein/permease, partial [Gemmatimonadota bacterium]|nr:ABC transporter ATP-binding protein/permease [Gemmatimonadota bacterium]